MSEQKHTPEPWYFDTKSRVGVDDLSICAVDAIDEYRPGGWDFGETSEANARRIVACVNACEGLSQDALDGGWTAKGISDYAKKLEAQRDAIEKQMNELFKYVRHTKKCANNRDEKCDCGLDDLIDNIEAESQK